MADPLNPSTDVFAVAITTDDHDTIPPPLGTASRLACVAGPDLGSSYRVGAGPCVIGRGQVGVNLHAGDVSRNHAQVSRPLRRTGS